MSSRIAGFSMHTRRRRRAVVITLYASYAALVACFALAGRDGVGLVFTLLLAPVGVVLVGSFMALSQIALPYSSEGVGVRLPPLDERQLQVRDRAFYRAYQIAASIFGLWIVYDAIARTNNRQWLWTPTTFDQYQAIVWAYLLLSMTLPSAIIAWTEPDIPDETAAQELRLAR
jgi:hypothetical protein